MEAIMMPVVILGITGLLMGLFLAFASKKFEVEVDPKVEAILAILPGVNCGACGYPGCSGYASGVALEGAKMTLCAPGGPKVAEKIGNIMGVEVEMPVKKKPAKKPVEKKVPQTGEPISASQEFIEKNKKTLNSFKEAFDAKDEEKMEKLRSLAEKMKKDDLLKYYEEIKAGKSIPDPAAMGAAPKVEMISAPKEFVEKNKKTLNSFKEAFNAKDEEKIEKLRSLAEKMKTGKSVPDPATMVATAPTEETKKEEVKAEEPKVEKAEENKKQEAAYCSILGDGLCVPEQNEQVKEEIAKQEAAPKSAEELEKEKQAATYCSVLGDGLCVPEENAQIVKENLAHSLDKEMK